LDRLRPWADNGPEPAEDLATNIDCAANCWLCVEPSARFLRRLLRKIPQSDARGIV
jgi:bacterioferritin-associated ferredoxin